MTKRILHWLLGMAVAILAFSSSMVVLWAQENGDDGSSEQKVFLPLVAGDGTAVEQSDSTTTPLLERTDQIIVQYSDETQAAAMDRTAQVAALSEAAEVELAFVRELGDNAIVVKLGTWKEPDAINEIIDHLLSIPEVAYAEPDTIMRIQQTPNDPRFGEQWHYAAPIPGTYGANLPAAWDITTGATSIVVAVIDTGILNHADLAGRTVSGYDFIGDIQVANDGNGRDNNPSDPGDWITSAENASGYFQGCGASNSSWHGTHVAGTIAANSNNGVGVAGISWGAKILPVRVLGKCGGYTSDIVDGIRWAAGLSVSGVPANANPARVINLSLGGSGTCSTTYRNAINAAVNAGTVVVVAAGNSNANAANYTPASCANVITVASTGRTGNRAYYSNYGSTVEISAPGGDKNIDSGILSTLNTGTTTPAADSYAFYQGTSMATPHVAGIVSLILSVNPSLTPAQVTALLQSNVTPFPTGSTCNTSNCGAGIINAGAAVAAAQGQNNVPPSAFAKNSPANGGAVTTTSATLSWGASVGATSYQYCMDTSNNNSCDSGNWINNGAATSVLVADLAVGSTYYWQVQAVNAFGVAVANSGTWWSFTVQATPPGAFNKSSPRNGSTRISTNTTLRWGTSSGATSYQVCIDTSGNDNCDGTWTTISGAQASVTGLARRTTYYWQVRALNGSGTTDANSGAWWRFTTR